MRGLRMLLRRGEEPLLHLWLDRSEVAVGRAPTNDVVVPDAEAEVVARFSDQGSGRYRVVQLDGGHLLVDGLPAAAGAYVGPGDRLMLGGYVLEVGDEPPERTGRTRGHEPSAEADGRGEAWLYAEEVSHRLDPGARFTIGSDSGNDLVLEDPYVSAYHCQLDRIGGAWRLTDLGSTNGTTVNDLRVREAELPESARIGVGGYKLRFSVVQDQLSMVAASPAMREVFRWVERYAEADEPVLVIGPSGCGKEGVSRALHERSRRSRGPYVALNCGALAGSLIESELFGHVKGAFTGATHDKKGAFELAHGGTLFLDEIGELPLELQPKLLRVLETKTVRRVGGAEEIRVAPRIVAATHRDLAGLVAEGRFREDLFHRLFVLGIAIPPLADRPEDVVALTEHFLSTMSPRPRTISDAGMAALMHHPWPGNVRELRNLLIRAVVSTDAERLEPEHLDFSQGAFARRERGSEEEKRSLLAALERHGGNRAAAARALGISKSTFYDRVRRLGVTVPRRR